MSLYRFVYNNQQASCFGQADTSERSSVAVLRHNHVGRSYGPGHRRIIANSRAIHYREINKSNLINSVTSLKH
jgi:hypothetical protein